MPTASAIRLQIETALAKRVSSALTPVPRIVRPIVPTGVADLDSLLNGGIPAGAITEMVGANCTGRTSVALSFLASLTRNGRVCAWVDVSNELQPESAAAAGIDLSRLLWVRCGTGGLISKRLTESTFRVPEKYLVPRTPTKGLHGGGFGPHPRTEVKGLSDAVSTFLASSPVDPLCGEPRRKVLRELGISKHCNTIASRGAGVSYASEKPWARLAQAMRATDLLLHEGGFSAIVLDMGSIRPEHSSRVEISTWFRYRAAAERTQASVLLLTQYACAKSSAELVLRFHARHQHGDVPTVFTGIEYQTERERHRFTQQSNVVPFKKPPQRETAAVWQSTTPWAGRR